MESELPLHYARALFELIQPKEHQAYMQAWEVLLTSLEEESWAKFLESYAISKDEKYEAIDKIYASFPSPTFQNFLKVVISHNRAGLLPQIGAAFRSLVNEASGVKEGILFSASPLSKKDVEAITKAMEKKLGCHVYLKEKVDHTLLGGVKVQIEGKVYDGTLRSRLQELHRCLKGGAR